MLILLLSLERAFLSLGIRFPHAFSLCYIKMVESKTR